jgi:hypothetical protein
MARTFIARFALCLIIVSTIAVAIVTHDQVWSEPSFLGKWGPDNISGSCSSRYMIITEDTITNFDSGRQYPSMSYTLDGETMVVNDRGAVMRRPFKLEGDDILIISSGPAGSSNQFIRCN